MFYRSNLSNLSGTFTQHNISYGSAAGQGVLLTQMLCEYLAYSRLVCDQQDSKF